MGLSIYEKGYISGGNNMKKDTEKQKYYYALFWKLYDSECMCLGKRWIERIASQSHYSCNTMKKICIVLKWFNDNFDCSKQYLCLAAYGNASLRAFVYNKDDDSFAKFVCFGRRKNKIYAPITGIKDGEYEKVDQCEYLIIRQ